MPDSPPRTVLCLASHVKENFHMPDLGKRPDITHAVSYLARETPATGRLTRFHERL